MIVKLSYCSWLKRRHHLEDLLSPGGLESSGHDKNGGISVGHGRRLVFCTGADTVE
jgi:hypothetical protein